jgi:hypothetical protein
LGETGVSLILHTGIRANFLLAAEQIVHIARVLVQLMVVDMRGTFSRPVQSGLAGMLRRSRVFTQELTNGNAICEDLFQRVELENCYVKCL